MREGFKLRAVLPGGASTPLIPADDIDVLMDFDHMKKAGYGLGTGTALLIDDSVCPVGLCLNLVRFFAQESCGWCTPCWAGLPWVVDVLNDIEHGRGRPDTSTCSPTRCGSWAKRCASATWRRRHQSARRGPQTLPLRVRSANIAEGGCRYAAPGRLVGATLPQTIVRPAPACCRPAGPRPEPGALMATVTIEIDGARHEVDDTRNLLDTCLSLGYDVPYFCWHPDLGSIGACRQCAVKLFWDDDDQKGEIVMGLPDAPREGNRVAISDPDAVRFRATVIELLMISHPQTVRSATRAASATCRT